MNLFEFLMILLSLIVGLGLAEILSGMAGVLKKDGLRAFSWTHTTLLVIILLSLLQTFWESWALNTFEQWSFPALLLMLGSPTILFMIARVIFPEPSRSISLDDYYFERARLIWTLGAVTVVVGTLFRPIAFGLPLWVIDNASAIPILLICILLATIRKRVVHHILVPLVLLGVLLDTLTINYTIS